MKIMSTWSDKRVQFNNMMPGIDLRLLHEEWSELWVPDYKLHNTEDTIRTLYLDQEIQSSVTASLSISNASFQSLMEYDLVNYVYAGNDVKIQKENAYTQELLCQYQWHHYPFDTQGH